MVSCRLNEVVFYVLKFVFGSVVSVLYNDYLCCFNDFQMVSYLLIRIEGVRSTDE